MEKKLQAASAQLRERFEKRGRLDEQARQLAQDRTPIARQFELNLVQKRLDENDALNTWITHIGSAVYAIPPGIAPGEYPGQGLLEA